MSPSHFEAVRQYILKQEEHHQKVSFQAEFLSILRKYDVTFDERYLWDSSAPCVAPSGQESFSVWNRGVAPGYDVSTILAEDVLSIAVRLH